MSKGPSCRGPLVSCDVEPDNDPHLPRVDAFIENQAPEGLPMFGVRDVGASFDHGAVRPRQAGGSREFPRGH